MKEILDDQTLKLELIQRKLEFTYNSLANIKETLSRIINIDPAEIEQELPTETIFTADDISIFSSGFFQRESDASGQAYRWTGDGPFCELRFFVNRNVVNRFTLDGGDIGQARVSDLRVFVDYAEIPYDLDRNGNRFVISGKIPPDPFSTRAVLTFWSPHRLVPADAIAGAQDRRTLWFVFYGLRIEAAIFG